MSVFFSNFVGVGDSQARCDRPNASLPKLFLCLPIVFFIAYGIPGIPSELILLAAPIAELLNIPKTILPVFLALYTGLQMGLPDSFRTAANGTDVFINAILLNDIYEEKVNGTHRQNMELSTPKKKVTRSLNTGENLHQNTYPQKPVLVPNRTKTRKADLRQAFKSD